MKGTANYPWRFSSVFLLCCCAHQNKNKNMWSNICFHLGEAHAAHAAPTERAEAFGEFLRTFTFGGPTLPVVQPGGALPLGVPSVVPENLRLNSSQDGLLVPRGSYWIRWIANPTG